MSARIAVAVFPGTNCELDVAWALEQVGASPELLWHTETDLNAFDGVVVPGGFAHGDYLRSGAIARFSPIMSGVSAKAAEGAPVLGICNGFQILTEAQLLPGALRRNVGTKFICSTVDVRVEATDTAVTGMCKEGEVLSLPINHFEGNYVCDASTLDELRAENRIVFRYTDNPNGSIDDIAGICNVGRNVVGLMPHPERAIEKILGSDDGRALFLAMISSQFAGASA